MKDENSPGFRIPLSVHQRSLLNMTSNNGADKFHQKPQIAVQDAHASIIIPPLTLLPEMMKLVSLVKQVSKSVISVSCLEGHTASGCHASLLPGSGPPLSLPLSSLRGQNHNSRNSTQPKNTSQTLRRTERPNRRSPQGPTWHRWH